MATQSTVFDTLKDQFGDSLEGASLCQKLILMESTALSLRMGIGLNLAIANLDYRGIKREVIEGLEALNFGDSTHFRNVNEGLRVITLLYQGIVEDCSVRAAKERLDG